MDRLTVQKTPRGIGEGPTILECVCRDAGDY